MLFKDVHPENTLFPMVVIVQGMVTEVRPVQPENAPSLMEVTLYVFVLPHEAKVTLSGMTTSPEYLPSFLSLTAALYGI